jgi:3-hydroxyacyl-CoA dehydrogenase
MILQHVSAFGVIGAGQMGAGIAQIAAQYLNRPVLLYDYNPVALEKGIQLIGTLLL